MAEIKMPTNFENKPEQSLETLIDFLAGIYESSYIIATVLKQWSIQNNICTEETFTDETNS